MIAYLGRYFKFGVAEYFVSHGDVVYYMYKLLYRVKSSNLYIKQLAFTRASMLLADI